MSATGATRGATQKGTRLFEALAEDLRSRKDAFPGGRLDPIPTLARDAGVSKATMQKALDSLRAQGLVESYRGKGTFWSGAGAYRAAASPGNSLVTLAGKLRDRVLDGTYRAGKALPKVGFISSHEGVSPDTVCAAFKLLEGESLIRKHGKSWLAGGADAGRHASPVPNHRTPRNAPAILLVVPDYALWDQAYHDEHSGKFVQNFYLEIERMGMETHLATASPSDSGFFAAGRPRIQALIQSLGVRYQGAMYIARDAEPGLLSWLGRFKRPVVWLDLQCLIKDMDMRTIPGGARLFRCLKDEEAAVSMALEALAGLGHRRIGFPVLRSPEFPWIAHRSLVLRKCAAEISARAGSPLQIVESEHKEGFWHPKPWLGPEDFPAWLERYRGPKGSGKRKSLRELIPSLMDLLDKGDGPVTAILAPNDFFAHQYYLWFREMGLRVPGDVTLLSFDNNHWSRPFSISSIDFGFSDLSYQVAHIFLGDIPVKPDALHNLRSRPVLMGRDTLGPLKSKTG